MLNERSLSRYLMARGLITGQQIVESGLRITGAPHRNSNFKVIPSSGPAYFVKHADSPDKRATLAGEAAFYAAVQNSRAAGELLAYAPRCFNYEPDEGVLILELLTEGETLLERSLRTGNVSVRVSAEVGRALAALHSLPEAYWKAELSARPFGESPHWALSLHRPALETVRGASRAGIHLMRLLQRFPEFMLYLDALRDEWQQSALIHADVKWNNIVVCPPSGSAPETIKLVDWELARPGDPCWDTGSAFAAYLTFWIFSIPITGDDPPDRFLSLAKFPLAPMRKAIGAFWNAYITRPGARHGEATTDLLLRSVRYAAVRLIQTAYEQAQVSQQLTGNLVCMLQLALNILKRPDDAARVLLGISP